jgi:DNA primase
VLALIVQAASQAPTTMICTDADLGGVRIAARIYDHLPAETAARIIDVGAAEHDTGRAFNVHSQTRLQQLATRTDQIGLFAQHCLDRGYAIEQEATARAALREVLDSRSSDQSGDD